MPKVVEPEVLDSRLRASVLERRPHVVERLTVLPDRLIQGTLPPVSCGCPADASGEYEVRPDAAGEGGERRPETVRHGDLTRIPVSRAQTRTGRKCRDAASRNLPTSSTDRNRVRPVVSGKSFRSKNRPSRIAPSFFPSAASPSLRFGPTASRYLLSQT